MPNTTKFPFIQRVIDQWPDRAKAAGLTHKELSSLSGLTEKSFSQLINGHIQNPRMSTIDRVERVLAKRGV